MPKSFKIIDPGKIHTLSAENSNRIIWSKSTNKFPLQIFTGSSDRTIKILTNETTYTTLRGHTSTITCLLYLNECFTLISGSSDTKIKIWSLLKEDGECLKTLEGHQSSITQLVSIPTEKCDKFISASQFDKTFRIWDFNTGECLKIIHDRKGGGATSCLIFRCNKNDELVSASWDRMIKMWNIQSGKCLLTVRAHSSWINCLLLKKDLVYSGSMDKTIKSWNLNSEPKCVQTFCGHKDSISSLVNIPNSNEFASGSFDRTIRIWDTRMGVCLKELRLVASSISCLMFNEFTEEFVLTCAVYDVDLIKFCHFGGRKMLKWIKSDHRGAITTLLV